MIVAEDYKIIVLKVLWNQEFTTIMIIIKGTECWKFLQDKMFAGWSLWTI